MIRDYLNFVFGSPTRSVDINAISISRDSARTARNSRVHVANWISYCLGFVLIGSFVGIVLSIILDPGSEVPVVLHEIFFAVLGYFGGALVSFLKSQ